MNICMSLFNGFGLVTMYLLGTQTSPRVIENNGRR